MKMTYRFTIFLISAIIFSFMFNVANADSDDDTKKTTATNGNAQANENDNVVEMIQTGEDITAITERKKLYIHFNDLFKVIDDGIKDIYSTEGLKNFRNEYKNTQIKLEGFKVAIGDLLQLYHDNDFDMGKIKKQRKALLKNNNDAQHNNNESETTTQTTTDYNQQSEIATQATTTEATTTEATTHQSQIIPTEEQYRLIDGFAAKILETCVKVRDDPECSNVVKDDKRIQRYMHDILWTIRGEPKEKEVNVEFNNACGTQITERPAVAEADSQTTTQ